MLIKSRKNGTHIAVNRKKEKKLFNFKEVRAANNGAESDGEWCRLLINYFEVCTSKGNDKIQ